MKLQLFPHGQVMDNGYEHNYCMCCVLCTTVWWICAQLIAKSEEVMRLLPQGKVGLPGQREASTHYTTPSRQSRAMYKLIVTHCKWFHVTWWSLSGRGERGCLEQGVKNWSVALAWGQIIFEEQELWRSTFIKDGIVMSSVAFGHVEFDFASSCANSFSFSLPGNLLWLLLHYSQGRSNYCNLEQTRNNYFGLSE